MWALNFDTWMKILPLGVFTASLLGSGHCALMCGPLATTMAPEPRALLRFHFGRLLGYCVLGALAGFAGAAVFTGETFQFVPWLSALSLGILFIISGIRLWGGRSPFSFPIGARIFQRYSRLGPAITGVLTSLLPCGWLHVFVLGAVATRSGPLGALYLFFFWLGTLPALSLSPLLVKRVFQPLGFRFPRVSALMLIAVGIITLSMKFAPHSHTHSHMDPSHGSHHHGHLKE